MPLLPGAKVRSRTDPGRIGIVERLGPHHAGIQYYVVFYGGVHGTQTVPDVDLVPHDPGVSPSQHLVNGNLAGYQAFQRLLTFQRLVRDHPLQNNIYAFNASRTRFYPYQFKPLIKLLDSPRHRLLVCDEVGLGKTIEAGLILVELRARQTMDSVLVVCPSNLTAKWKLELGLRFAEEFRILQVRDLLEYLDDYENTPGRAAISGIISLESIRADVVLDRLEALAPSFDLVIVDEAHHMRNFGRKQRRAGELLSRCAAAMVMLTATPVHLGNNNLFSLLNILDEEDFPDEYTATRRFAENEPVVRAQSLISRVPPALVDALASLQRAAGSTWVQANPLFSDVAERLQHMIDGPSVSSRDVLDLQRDVASLNLLGHMFTRTRKREVHTDVSQRRPRALVVEFSPLEREFYEAVSVFVQAESEAAGHMPVIQRWRLNTPQRRMASSVPAMVEYYRQSLPWAEADVAEEMGEDEEDEMERPSEGAAQDVLRARERLMAILRRWPTTAPDSKYECLLSILTELKTQERRCKVLVFATFVGTLEYLSRRLRADGFGARLITGSVPPEDRGGLIAEFRDNPEVEVFLSSRVGSEGLDFQFCDTLFNYDLPWNPMEVEQRIGRLDRIGQESPTIRIFNLWVSGTIEERILRRLYERIGIFERSIGDLEAILGDIVQRLERDILSKTLTPEEQAQRADEAALALEKKLQETEVLESEAARFVGTDAYFAGEVEAIRQRRRFVTAVQLQRFVDDFLRHYAPRARLEYDHAAQVGRLIPDSGLRDFIRRRHKSHDLVTLLSAGDRGLQLTFDSQTAFRAPQIDFINVLHPLVTSIVDEYSERVDMASAATHVRLRSGALTKGFYFFFVFRLRIHAARQENTLQCIILREDGEEACTASEAETILGEMVEQGEEPLAAIDFDPQVAEQARNRGYLLFLDREQQARRQVDRSNDAFVDSRLASLRTSYTKNIQKQRNLLERGVLAQRQERYLRLLKGTITRLEGELAEREADLEALRAVEVAHDEIAAGVLEVA